MKVVRQWLTHQTRRPKLIVEPFAGGASVSLAAINEGLVDHAFFSERDRDVAATWKVMLNGEAAWLAERIRLFRLSRKTVGAILRETPASLRERAFKCLLRNRTARGGVIAQGAGLIREGEDGNGLGSRWYPDTLAKRVALISSLKAKLKFTEGDGFKLIRRFSRHKHAVFFVDPPYTKAARRLYEHWQIDHEALFRLLSRVKGNVLMTYDDTPEIRRLAAKHGFQVRCITMRTTHHQRKRELMICRDFSWQRRT